MPDEPGPPPRVPQRVPASFDTSGDVSIAVATHEQLHTAEGLSVARRLLASRSVELVIERPEIDGDAFPGPRLLGIIAQEIGDESLDGAIRFIVPLRSHTDEKNEALGPGADGDLITVEFQGDALTLGGTARDSPGSLDVQLFELPQGSSSALAEIVAVHNAKRLSDEEIELDPSVFRDLKRFIRWRPYTQGKLRVRCHDRAGNDVSCRWTARYLGDGLETVALSGPGADVHEAAMGSWKVDVDCLNPTVPPPSEQNVVVGDSQTDVNIDCSKPAPIVPTLRAPTNPNAGVSALINVEPGISITINSRAGPQSARLQQVSPTQYQLTTLPNARYELRVTDTCSLQDSFEIFINRDGTLEGPPGAFSASSEANTYDLQRLPAIPFTKMGYSVDRPGDLDSSVVWTAYVDNRAFAGDGEGEPPQLACGSHQISFSIARRYGRGRLSVIVPGPRFEVTAQPVEFPGQVLQIPAGAFLVGNASDVTLSGEQGERILLGDAAGSVFVQGRQLQYRVSSDIDPTPQYADGTKWPVITGEPQWVKQDSVLFSNGRGSTENLILRTVVESDSDDALELAQTKARLILRSVATALWMSNMPKDAKQMLGLDAHLKGIQLEPVRQGTYKSPDGRQFAYVEIRLEPSDVWKRVTLDRSAEAVNEHVFLREWGGHTRARDPMTALGTAVRLDAFIRADPLPQYELAIRQAKLELFVQTLDELMKLGVDRDCWARALMEGQDPTPILTRNSNWVGARITTDIKTLVSLPAFQRCTKNPMGGTP